MPRLIVCDVNETLLDIGALEPQFKQAFGDGRALQDWFGTVLLYSEVATLAGPYHIDFLSLDVEGSELDVLKELNLDKYRPTCILVEARFFDEVDGCLQPHYVLVEQLSHHDYLYKSRAA